MGVAARVRSGRGAAGGQGPAGRGRARASATVPAAVPPVGQDPVAPRLAERAGSIGPVRLQQLVLVELAAAVVLVGRVVGPVLLAPAAVVAAGLLLLALVRRGRRPVAEWLFAAASLRRRARRAAAEPVPPGTDPRFAPVAECEPALRTGSFTDRGQRPVGVVGDGTFLTAVLQVEAVDAPLRRHRTEKGLPLALLRDAMEVDGILLESVQIVQSALPAPAPHLPAQTLAARNYAPLQEQTGAPAARLTWVALKFDPQLCPEAVAARGGGPEGAQRCLLRAGEQLASRLRGAGFSASLLSEDGLTAALATAANVNPAATAQAGQASRAGAPVRRTQETVRAWRCDDRWHATYWVGRWPQLGPGAASLPQLAALLTSMPALSTTMSLTLGRGSVQGGRHAPTLAGHIRICGRSADELVTVGGALERASRAVKAGLVRLDHEQVPGVLATLPLGGTH